MTEKSTNQRNHQSEHYYAVSRHSQPFRDVIFPGNINPYVTSYLRNVTGNSYVDYTDTFWIFQATDITMCICMPLVGLLANRIPVKGYMLIGILFNA